MRLPKVGEYWLVNIGIRLETLLLTKGKVLEVYKKFGTVKILYEHDLHSSFGSYFYREDSSPHLSRIGTFIRPCYTDYPNTSLFKKLYTEGYEHNGFWRVDESI